MTPSSNRSESGNSGALGGEAGVECWAVAVNAGKLPFTLHQNNAVLNEVATDPAGEVVDAGASAGDRWFAHVQTPVSRWSAISQ